MKQRLIKTRKCDGNQPVNKIVNMLTEREPSHQIECDYVQLWNLMSFYYKRLSITKKN